ncbi:MAG: hypothetical protein IIC92_08390 [Chloroflexi bacterium]|nr:hypothetical protein [Chloroflexota bacterium]
MSEPVIRRYFDDRATLARVTRDFGRLIRFINASHAEYTLQLRQNSFNVYYRGSSLASVRPSGRGRYSVRIHRRFLQGTVKDKMSQHCDEQPYGGADDGASNIRFYVRPAQLPRFFQSNHLSALASNIARVNYSEELAFEQVLMTDNPASERLIVIDRQIADHSWTRQLDLLALARDSDSGPFHFLVIEVKTGKNPELRHKVGQQLTDYLDHIREHFADYIDCYKENYRQKKLMGLFGDDLPAEIEIESSVKGLVISGGYSRRAEEAKAALVCDYPDIRVQIIKNVIDPT